MANKTIFQNLGRALFTGFNQNVDNQMSNIHTYNINSQSPIFTTTDKGEYENKKNQMSQERFLGHQWIKSGGNLSRQTAMTESNLKLMYRDCDLMDNYPEIGAALDLFAEESCVTSSKGSIINITSSSKRIKNVLEDLFINRLDGHITIPMWTRTMCKYGNCFTLLNVTSENGIIGSRQMPVYEMNRVENGVWGTMANPNSYAKNLETEFVWMGQNEQMPFKNWQIAHFRLLTDSTFLPYGVSVLNKARRHWRILSMMEDMMLIYRLERGIERRVFKINVGNIDDADVPAYMNEIANTFKRTPIIDPMTGQLDLKKASLDVSQDYFIPVRTEGAQTPIDVLAGASNIDKIEDLKYIQNKIMTALRVPGEFLNFEQSAGNGKNLALKDIRFTRTINRIQQAVIMELTKIALIHLYILGFRDDLSDFKITMNSPSTQSEILKLEELSKKISLITDSVRDVGNGLQIMSLTRAQREILGWSDAEISDNMNEIRIERAMASELAKTDQIIKRTGFFDKIDKLYGEPGAEYVLDGLEGDSGGGDLGGGGSSSGSFDNTFSSEGEMGGDLGGEEMGTQEPQSTEPSNEQPEEPEAPKMENFKKDISKLLVETRKKQEKEYSNRKNTYFNSYMKYLSNNKITEDNNSTSTLENTFTLNESTLDIANRLEQFISPHKF